MAANAREINPELQFFRNTPPELVRKPHFVSSLQSFETCLFMIALWRHPDALVACVFSIEKVLRERYSGKNLDKILKKAVCDIPLQEFAGKANKSARFGLEEALNPLRCMRNKIVHKGFSRKDDDEAAGLLLKTGFDFLAACHSAIFSFNLADSLIVEFAEHIRISLESFKAPGRESAGNASVCLLALGHLIRWSMHDSLMSQSELAAAESASTQGFHYAHDVVDKRREKADQLFDPSWPFDCPICQGVDNFVVQLDDTQLDHGQVASVQGLCVDCNLKIPSAGQILLNILLQKQVKEKSEEILREYGLTAAKQ